LNTVRWTEKYPSLKEKTMVYKKPQVLAQNSKQGVFAAGCPDKNQGGVGSGTCRSCERSG
jgi:hypothetical protein